MDQPLGAQHLHPSVGLRAPKAESAANLIEACADEPFQPPEELEVSLYEDTVSADIGHLVT